MSFDLAVFKRQLSSYRGLSYSAQVTYRYINAAALLKGYINNALDSTHSFKRGYRFNFKNSFPTLYVGLSGLVAELEAGHRINPLSTRFDNREQEPGIMFSIAVSGHFVNLTDQKSLKSFSFNPGHPEYLIPTRQWKDQLKKGLPAITHRIGQEIYQAGFDGVIYYSYPAWNLRSQYRPDMISALGIFMSLKNPSKPQNPSCRLEVYKQEELIDRIVE